MSACVAIANSSPSTSALRFWDATVALRHSWHDPSSDIQRQRTMPSSLVRAFLDPDEYAAALRQGTINITVTERGSFGAKIFRVDFHDLWMQRLSEDLAKTSLDGWRGRAIIVFQTHPGSPLVQTGTELPWGSISRNGYYQRTLGPASFGGMSLPIDLMASISHTMVGQDLTSPQKI